MTINQIRYAIVIAQMGSFNKAASVLYVSQPNLTSAIKELEGELSIKIFNRSGRGVTLTNEGAEFLMHARQLYNQFESIKEKYGENGTRKKKFGVSTQHYSFAVKAFAQTVSEFDTLNYDFAIRETKTKEVIDDVAALKSEIGVLFLNNFNRTFLTKLFNSAGIDFFELVSCDAFVYLYKNHPLSQKSEIRFEELLDFPCLQFEQGETGSFYLSEEIFSTADYKKRILVNDRATMLNLMIELNGFTLCSGIICDELNGDDFLAVPLSFDETKTEGQMQIGYIKKHNQVLSSVGEIYIKKLKEYLSKA